MVELIIIIFFCFFSCFFFIFCFCFAKMKKNNKTKTRYCEKLSIYLYMMMFMKQSFSLFCFAAVFFLSLFEFIFFGSCNIEASNKKKNTIAKWFTDDDQMGQNSLFFGTFYQNPMKPDWIWMIDPKELEIFFLLNEKWFKKKGILILIFQTNRIKLKGNFSFFNFRLNIIFTNKNRKWFLGNLVLKKNSQLTINNFQYKEPYHYEKVCGSSSSMLLDNFGDYILLQINNLLKFLRKCSKCWW